jgi:threonine dehydrogenase-like Zn-dependent dehydrogenase
MSTKPISTRGAAATAPRTKGVAVDPARRTLELVDVDAPELRSPMDVKLRVLEVGICGTDREIVSFEYGTPPAGEEVLVLGHEALGEVVEVGAGVTGLAPGDLVVPTVRRPCPHAHCRPCREGRQDFCTTGDFEERGIKGRHGFMTELVVDEARYMNPVPADLREVAVLVEPLTIAEKGLAQAREIQRRLPWGSAAGHRAVVLGAGPVGLLGAMTLRLAGFETFVYSRPDAAKAALVEGIGARFVPSDTLGPDALSAEVGNIDLVYEAVGASQVSFEVLRVLGSNGVFVFTGVPGRRGPISLDADAIMRSLVLRNQVVLGTVNAGREAFRAAVADLRELRRRWPDAVEALITGRHPIERYRELLAGRPAGIKNVLTIGRG